MVIGAFTASYTQRTPYLTTQEYLDAPTALDLSNLVPDGSDANQETAAAELIGRASAICDNYCFGSDGTLCASLNQESNRLTATRDGSYFVHPRFWPILEVVSFAVGQTPGQVQAVPISSANCWVEEMAFTITAAPGSITSQGPLQFSALGYPGATVFATWSYVNGWPNTTLSAAVTAGATSASVANTTGIYPPTGLFPGTILTIYDAPNDETVQIASDYVPGSNPLLFANPLQYNHAGGISITALPPSIKQAAILVTTALVKERGSGDTIVLPESGSGPGSSVAGDLMDRKGDLGWAAEILDSFVQTVNM